MLKLLSPIALLSSLLITEVALARPLDVNLSIHRQGEETYNQLVHRAANLAQNTIEQRFKADSSIDALNVLVIAENQGAIAPLLSVKVNRENWNNNPYVQRWGSEFPFSKSLLNFESTTPPPAAPPPAAPPLSDQPEPGAGFLPVDELPPSQTDPRPLPEQRLRPQQ